jgi:heptosyltransferase I
MKIAIVKLSALGDIIHAMVVLQFIKNHSQKIQVDWVVEESYKELLEFHPDINKVHVVNLKKSKKKKSLYLLFNELRNVRHFGEYDIVIDMQGLIKSAVISRLISSTKTFGFDRLSARESIASIFYNRTFKYDYEENIIERNFELIKFALGLTNKKEEILKKQPFLHSSKKHLNANLSSIKKNIILIPGSSNRSKCFPVSKFVKLTTLLDANFIIIWGDSNEKELAKEIKVLSPDVNVCNKLDLEDLILLINQVNLVIGPDTGPTHMAWALNIPSITLFGLTPGWRNSYVTHINKIIESNSFVNSLKINKNDYSIKTIKVSEIVKMSQLLLEIK